eukprot:Clim_evm115s157 gene=Clim_evmTU115s157
MGAVQSSDPFDFESNAPLRSFVSDKNISATNHELWDKILDSQSKISDIRLAEGTHSLCALLLHQVDRVARMQTLATVYLCEIAEYFSPDSVVDVKLREWRVVNALRMLCVIYSFVLQNSSDGQVREVLFSHVNIIEAEDHNLPMSRDSSIVSPSIPAHLGRERRRRSSARSDPGDDGHIASPRDSRRPTMGTISEDEIPEYHPSSKSYEVLMQDIPEDSPRHLPTEKRISLTTALLRSMVDVTVAFSDWTDGEMSDAIMHYVLCLLHLLMLSYLSIMPNRGPNSMFADIASVIEEPQLDKFWSVLFAEVIRDRPHNQQPALHEPFPKQESSFSVASLMSFRSLSLFGGSNAAESVRANGTAGNGSPAELKRPHIGTTIGTTALLFMAMCQILPESNPLRLSLKSECSRRKSVLDMATKIKRRESAGKGELPEYDSQRSVDEEDMKLTLRLFVEEIVGHVTNEYYTVPFLVNLNHTSGFLRCTMEVSTPRQLFEPILRLLYNAENHLTRHDVTCLLIVSRYASQPNLVDFFSEESFDNVTWYEERRLANASLSDVISIIALRLVGTNFGKWHDAFVQMVLFNILTQLAQHWDNVHSHVCDRFMKLLRVMLKRRNAALKQRNASAKASQEKAVDFQVFDDYVVLMARILASVLSSNISKNPNLAYSVFYHRDVFEELIETIDGREYAGAKLLNGVFTHVEAKIAEMDDEVKSNIDVLRDMLTEAVSTYIQSDVASVPWVTLEVSNDRGSQEFFVEYITSLVSLSNPIIPFPMLT